MRDILVFLKQIPEFDERKTWIHLGILSSIPYVQKAKAILPNISLYAAPPSCFTKDNVFGEKEKSPL